MPIYEYTCQKCGHKFEELVLAGREPEKCPCCGHPKVKRQMSLFANCSPGTPSASSGGGGCCGSKNFS